MDFAIRYFCLLVIVVFYGCTLENEGETYVVSRLSQPIEINSIWDKEPWIDIPALQLDNYMGDAPDHRPIVKVKIAYYREDVYVIFQVNDRYVRCIMDQYQDPVSKDSAVEFFFTPSDDISKGYFNLEVNCGGTALFKFQKGKGGYTEIPKSTFDKIDVAHSLPSIVNPEIENKIIWTIEYRIPISILYNYFGDVNRPVSGAKWKANFYKIADKTSHPHWLTWSFVDYPEPRFHLPQFFGTLEFE